MKTTNSRNLLMLGLALLLAGCLDAGVSTDPAPTVSALAPLAFETPIKIIDLPNSQSETFIEVSDDGQTLLTCLHGFFQRPAPMLASTDGGTTWRELTATPRPGVSGDCEIALSPDGTWYFLHSTVAGATVAATSDEGVTWHVNPIGAIPINGIADRPWLEAADERLVLTYSGAGIAGRTSDDKGQSWSLPTMVVSNEPGDFDLPGHLVVGPDASKVYQPFLQFDVQYINSHGRPVEARIGYAASEDKGSSWTTRVIATEEVRRFHPAVAADHHGHMFFAYYGVNASLIDLVVRWSSDGGATWSDPVAAAPGLSGAGTLWMDGRPEGADLIYQSEGTVQMARVQVAEATIRNANTSLGSGSGEFFSIDHDLGGRAYVTLIRDEALWLVRETVAADSDG